MAKKITGPAEIKIKRPKRIRLSPEESLARMERFEDRKEAFVASVRKGKN